MGVDSTAVIDTTTTRCGDGVPEGAERCDDGDAKNGTYGFCAADCSGPGPRCGDGQTDEGFEVCDDGDGVNGTYGRCGAGCNGPAPFCGNGFADHASEACDDGENNGAYGYCLADCSAEGPRCGDGHADAPWELCDDGEDNGQPGKCGRYCGSSDTCGNGQPDGNEQCDDGPENGTYGSCAADCSGPAGFCGDGVVQKGHEVCDHGEDNGVYGHCGADCAAWSSRCGDGVRDETYEACDEGELNGEPGRCRLDCSGTALEWTPYPTTSAATSRVDGDACEVHDWLGKYMRYRKRLRGDGSAAHPGFVSIGRDAGQSMPASRREPTTGCDGYWAFDKCPRPDLPDARGMYKWGDGTIWLGGYLEVLATEHAMFADLGLDLSETRQDLYLALEAFNRVDEGAEAYFGAAPARDGFFLRDDVPADFYLTDGGAYRFPRDDGDLAGYECVGSDVSCETPSIEDGSFTSQDQVIGLLHGLALVAALVPDGVTVEGVDLRHAAREIVHRMVNKLRTDGWRVKDPTGESPPDAWGGNAIGFSNQMAKAANAICGEDFGVSDYRTFLSRTGGGASWSGLQVIWDATHNYNRTMALKLAAITNDWSTDKMARLAVGDGKDFYALTHALLNGIDRAGEALSPWRIESMLDSAPCSGPCRKTEGCDGDARGWRAEHRTWGPDDRSGSRHFPVAEFNGLDYMALHNAYYLYRKGQYAFEPPRRPAVECGGFSGLDDLLATGVSAPRTYDPTHACATPDLAQRFCGRSWASWVDAAYRGEVTIFTRGARWTCADGQPCALAPGDDEDHTSGDDLILGGPGDDALSGGAGNDCLVGFGGDDVLEGNQGFDELHGGEGNDQLYGESGNLIVLDGEQDELYGGPGDDLLRGGPDDDALYGGPGRDEMDGDGGDDILEGDEGDDVMRGGGGDDTLNGGPGHDSLKGDSGGDQIWGEAGRDRIDGESGDDSLDGGDGDDFVRGGSGDDTLAAGPSGRDRLCGNGGDDTLWGGWDGDACRGGGFLGGTDQVHGCEDDTASQSDCNSGAFDDW